MLCIVGLLSFLHQPTSPVTRPDSACTMGRPARATDPARVFLRVAATEKVSRPLVDLVAGLLRPFLCPARTTPLRRRAVRAFFRSNRSRAPCPDRLGLRLDLGDADLDLGSGDRTHGVVDNDRHETFHADGDPCEFGLPDELGRDDGRRRNTEALQSDRVSDTAGGA